MPGDNVNRALRELSGSGCEGCLYQATHEKCDLGGDSCLSTGGDGVCLYKHRVRGTQERALARLKGMEALGLRRIVIGGQGEADVSVKMDPEGTLVELERVAEHCGYGVTRGDWGIHYKAIVIGMPHGRFRLEYYHNQLTRIMKIVEVEVYVVTQVGLEELKQELFGGSR